MRTSILTTIALMLSAAAYGQLAESPEGVQEGLLTNVPNSCAANPDLGDINASPSWSGWGGTNNNRFQPAADAGLSAADVPKLKLKWAFGMPGGKSMYSQPAVAFGRVFVGNDDGVVYSLDAKTGCVYWAYQADMFGRFAPLIAPVKAHPGSDYGVYFVTRATNGYALDAHTGKLLWKTRVRNELNNLSATAAFHDGILYVPMSGTETLIGSNLDYECCKSSGAVAAVDANTGEVLWRTKSIPEPNEPIGKNSKGVMRYAPAGASVWNTPTVDAKRGVVYVGTGNNFGHVPSSTSDSILALRMSDGKMLWHHQEFSGDSFMVACGPTNPADVNCPEKLGPDYDFGGSATILANVDGKDIILAAGKGGVAIALDPDKNGELIWRNQMWTEGNNPPASGLVAWGGAFDGKRVYYPMQRAGGGLKALDPETGKEAWDAAINADNRGQAGPATAIPGVVFTGGWDGILRAVDTDGDVIWTYNAIHDYDTVNGVPAKGGSFGSAGPVVVDGMVYATSGYPGTLRGTPGNVLLAFGVE